MSERPDRQALTANFFRAGRRYFDDLLTPPALLGLQRYLLESTIWHDFTHIGGFVASYLEDGLACPLLLQIADELRSAFPDVFGDTAAFAGLGLQGAACQAAVDVHADDAAVSVNFWVTPTPPTSILAAADWPFVWLRRRQFGKLKITMLTRRAL